MSTESDKTTNPTDKAQYLRQLGHDVKSPLTVISMGLQALKSLRLDAQEFNEVYDTIMHDGLDQLKAAVDRLVQAACYPETPPEQPPE